MRVRGGCKARITGHGVRGDCKARVTGHGVTRDDWRTEWRLQ